MKKLVYLITVGLIALVILGVYKYNTGPKVFWPLTYSFLDNSYPQKNIEVPIVIIGDRLGARLARFKNMLSQKVSVDLSVPIKIESIAQKNEGIHRTIEKIKSLDRLPLIIIYFGGSQEFLEKKYESKDVDKILKNISFFEDLRIQSLMMLLPWASRFIYRNTTPVIFGPKVDIAQSKFTEAQVLKHNEIDFKFFEYELTELVRYTKDRNAILISITAPVNLDVAPKKSCDLTLDETTKKQFDQVVELVKKEDFKGAYRISKDLRLLASSNAKVHYIHGKIAQQLSKTKEAIKSLEYAASLDCQRWRSTPIHNYIMRKVAKKEEMPIFDLDKMLQANWTKNTTFQDDIYPQNYYMEQMVAALAGQLKILLKL